MSTGTGQSLAEFILARVADDEADARLAMTGYSTGEWTHDGGIYAGHPTAEIVDWAYGDTSGHIARHDPARVLAECEAKRRIIAAVTDWLDTHPEEDHVPAGDDVLCWLALPYRDHADFNPLWAVREGGV